MVLTRPESPGRSSRPSELFSYITASPERNVFRILWLRFISKLLGQGVSGRGLGTAHLPSLCLRPWHPRRCTGQHREHTHRHHPLTGTAGCSSDLQVPSVHGKGEQLSLHSSFWKPFLKSLHPFVHIASCCQQLHFPIPTVPSATLGGGAVAFSQVATRMYEPGAASLLLHAANTVSSLGLSQPTGPTAGDTGVCSHTVLGGTGWLALQLGADQKVTSLAFPLPLLTSAGGPLFEQCLQPSLNAGIDVCFPFPRSSAIDFQTDT